MIRAKAPFGRGLRRRGAQIAELIQSHGQMAAAAEVAHHQEMPAVRCHVVHLMGQVREVIRIGEEHGPPKHSEHRPRAYRRGEQRRPAAVEQLIASR